MRLLILKAALVVVHLTGCAAGELHNKMEYDHVTFIGPASGPYNRMLTGEMLAGSSIQHDKVVELFVRLEDGSVFKLSEFPEAEASRRARDKQRDPKGGLTYYVLPPSLASVHFRNGTIAGAALPDGIELSQKQQGPFVRLPLQRAEITDLLGEANRESTFRGSLRWN